MCARAAGGLGLSSLGWEEACWTLPPALTAAPPVRPLCLQLLVVSDLFTERSQFEMMYQTLTELRRVHPPEDEILLQYLVPATCKAAAVLGMVSRGHPAWRRGGQHPPQCPRERPPPV